MSRSKHDQSKAPCPCCSGKAYTECCKPVIEGERPAATAEVLMRSRFSAFALGREDWLSTSWHPDTRPSPPLLSQPPLKWIDLKVLRHDQTTVDSAQVEFVARFRDQGRAGRLHENSRFLRVEAQWLYVDGEIRENPRGRIDTPAPPQTSLRASTASDDTRTFADKTS